VHFYVHNIAFPLKMFCPQSTGNDECNWRKCYDSHAASSFGRFFHLIRYSLITRDRNFFSLVAIMASGSRMILPSSSNIGSSVALQPFLDTIREKRCGYGFYLVIPTHKLCD
jgi:hypothetical protein